MMPFEIKLMNPGDELLAAKTISQIKKAEVGVAYMKRFLLRPENVLLVAVSENQPIGFALAYQLDRVDGELPMVFFYELEVLEERRRQGIGRALVDSLRGICRQRGVRKMFVLTDRRNHIACHLYSGAGGHVEYDDGVLLTYE
jgi:GNAT superfamily N-acetyltransferase